MKYMSYKIERIDPNQVGNWGNKWGVFAENHDVDPTGRRYTHWELTYRARTLEEAKQGCRCHFGRL